MDSMPCSPSSRCLPASLATVGVNGAQNAAILAVEMLALADEALATRLEQYKDGLKEKIVKANAELATVCYKNKTN